MKASSAPRQPFVGLALSAVAGIAAADIFPPARIAVPVAVATSALFAFAWPGSKRTYILIAVCFFVLHSFHVEDSPGLELAQKLGDVPRATNATGLVVSEARTTANGMATFLLRLHAISVDGTEEKSHATIRVRWRGTVEPGDELQLFGLLGPIAPPRNPGEFDMRSYLARRDIRQELFVRYPENAAILRRTTPNPILRAAQKSRRWMQDVLCRGLEGSPEVQGMINGMALGVRHETEEDIEEPFQQTGTLHLFAVAGLHVGIVARLLWILAMVLHLPRKWTIALIIPALFFYAAVTGLHTSSVRAAVMSAVLLAGFFVERKGLCSEQPRSCGVPELSWDTNELFSLGFQLSFSVVAAIILFADPIFRFLRRWGAPDPFLPRVLLRAPRRFLDASLGWICRGASVWPQPGSVRFHCFFGISINHQCLGAREPRGGADCVFHSRDRDALAACGDFFLRTVCCLQQCQLGVGQGDSRRRACVRADSGRSLLCGTPALAEWRGSGNHCVRRRRRRRGPSSQRKCPLALGLRK